MKNFVIGWLALALALTFASVIAKPYLNSCGAADIAFAREYAGEMLTLLEHIASEAEKLGPSPAAADYFRDSADELDRRKRAAVHLKGDLAYDFVYAFACAEDWCRAAARARPLDDDAGRRARAAHERARQEFIAITAKDYRSTGR